MLTAELVRVRTHGGEISPIKLGKRTRERALEIGRLYIEHLMHVRGASMETVLDGFGTIELKGSEKRLADGLRKLLMDRCEFSAPPEGESQALRRDVFTKAAEIRSQLEEEVSFSREGVLQLCSTMLGLDIKTIEETLFADLRSAQTLECFDVISSESLVAQYELAQEQAILLKALSVNLRVRFVDSGCARRFFDRLKFRRLLFNLREGEAGWYELEIEGPLSLFRSSTKYGLQLALLLPHLREEAEFEMDATVLWGKAKRQLKYRVEGKPSGVQKGKTRPLPDEVHQLKSRFQKLSTSWVVKRSRKLLNLPGVGLCVPDLVFVHQKTKMRVFLEVMGFWSRDAVWRRIDLAREGLNERIIFAVSDRLRVSESLLDPEEQYAALYVYKGVLNAKSVADRLTLLHGTQE